MQQSIEFERKILKLAGANKSQLFKFPHVHGYYVGKKIVAGVDTMEPCVVFTVSKKKPSHELQPEEIIPGVMLGGVKTDVIEMPKLTADGFCGGADPVPPSKRRSTGCPDHIYNNDTLAPYSDLIGGVSVGNAGIMDAGSMGLIVRDRDSRRMVGLTCNHAVGLQPYAPGSHQPVTEYVLTDNGFTFILNNADKTESHVEGKLDGAQFPKMIAGNLYKFTNESNLHDMYVSTQDTKNNGGGSLNPYINITIYDKNGDIRYMRGRGTGTPSISSGEIMFVTPATDLGSQSLHYGSWVYPNVGAAMQITYFGVPPCRSSNRDNPVGQEYTDGLLLTRNKNLVGNQLGHPGNTDAGVGGSGQLVIGAIDKIEPIMFCHPTNTHQPINKIDACTFELNTDVIQGKAGVLHLCERPLVASNSWQGAELFKVGRTTGVTPSGAEVQADGTIGGNTNKCKIISTSATISIDYCVNHTGTIQGTAIFEDVLLYELHNEWIADTGDSGSALLMKDETDGNRTKLIGLHIASGYDDANGDGLADSPMRSFGVGCRIQNVFEALNLTNWEGTIILPMDDPCVKLDGLCYSRDVRAYTSTTHSRVDEVFDDCGKCEND